MPHYTPLIGTIVAGLVIAFAMGALAHRIKVSPIAGYLLAGVIVGPFTPGYVADTGLAMQLAGDAWPDLDQAMSGNIKVITLTYLEGKWGALLASASTVAYLEANSATRYLIERWGMATVDELLNALQTKSTIAAAIQDKLFVSYEQFQRQWLESFERIRP